MTRARIAELLERITLALANETPAPPDVEPVEWAYVKGIAGHAVMTTRDRLIAVDRAARERFGVVDSVAPDPEKP